MRSVVSLVEARPETIAEDYGRVLDLAGLKEVREGGARALLAAQASATGWFPGRVSPPWQLAGVLDWLSGSAPGPVRATVAAVDPQVGRSRSGNPGWDGVMAERGAVTADDGFWRPRPWSPVAHLPALKAALPGGFAVPAGLGGAPLILMPVPSLTPAWPVAGAIRLLVSLVLGRLGRPRRAAAEETLAEAVSLCLEVLEGKDGTPSATVMDGVIWEIGPGHRGRGPVTRNVLLAGRDPVAVDTVATILGGADPSRVPWLRLCKERGLGAARAADIRLAGQVDLVDRPFGHPASPTRAGGLRLAGLEDLSWRILRQPTILRRHRGTPWGRLYEDYRLGANPGESR